MLKKFALAAVLALTAAGASAESKLDFTIVNATGYGIKELYVAPTASDDWEENILDAVLQDKESLKITFSPKAESAGKWDIMITWEDGGDSVYWRGYDLTKISKITLKYNRGDKSTTASVE